MFRLNQRHIVAARIITAQGIVMLALHLPQCVGALKSETLKVLPTVMWRLQPSHANHAPFIPFTLFCVLLASAVVNVGTITVVAAIGDTAIVDCVLIRVLILIVLRVSKRVTLSDILFAVKNASQNQQK